MGIRSTVLANPETLSDLLLAADDRYADAEELLLQQRLDGALYLIGYAAEMWLKAACLRLRGGGPNVQVKSSLGPRKTFMAVAAPHVPFTTYHDLAYLAQCVTYLRISVGRPLPPLISAELRGRVGHIHSEWIVDMRYRRTGVSESDFWALLVNVWWLRSNWVQLT